MPESALADILIIDRDQPDIEAMSRELELRDHHVRRLEWDGAAPLRAPDPLPRLVVLGIGGNEELSKLKAFKSSPGWTDVPVIVWAKCSEPEDLTKAIELGADVLLPRGDDLYDLLNFVGLTLG